MENLEVIVGNTVDFIIEVEGMSSNPTEAKIELYEKKAFPEGMQGLLQTYTPVSTSGTTLQFTFDTDVLMPSPGSIYGRFFVNDSGKKINAYFKLKFTY